MSWKAILVLFLCTIIIISGSSSSSSSVCTCKSQCIIVQAIIDEHDPFSVPLPLPVHITPFRLDVIRCYFPCKMPATGQTYVTMSA